LQTAPREVAHDEQRRCEDGRSGIAIVIKLCQEVANETGQPCGTAEIVGTISPREQKQLILLLVEEMVGVSRLKEDIAGNGPKKNTEVR